MPENIGLFSDVEFSTFGTNTVVNDTLPLFQEYYMDIPGNNTTNINENLVLSPNKDFILVSGNDALAIWCYKALITRRNTYPIYDTLYGEGYYNAIWLENNKSLIENIIVSEVDKALTYNDYIISVSPVSLVWHLHTLTYTFNVNTVYGTIENMNFLGGLFNE